MPYTPTISKIMGVVRGHLPTGVLKDNIREKCMEEGVSLSAAEKAIEFGWKVAPFLMAADYVMLAKLLEGEFENGYALGQSDQFSEKGA